MSIVTIASHSIAACNVTSYCFKYLLSSSSSHVLHFLSIAVMLLFSVWCFYVFYILPMLSFSRVLLWCLWLCQQSFRLLLLSSVWSKGFMQEPIVMSGHWITYSSCQSCLLHTHIWPSFPLILDVAPTSLLTGTLSNPHAQRLPAQI